MEHERARSQFHTRNTSKCSRGVRCHHIHARPLPRKSPLHHDFAAAAGPRAPLGAPVWKPFLNFRATCLRYRIRPVPVVFRRLAFALHSSGDLTLVSNPFPHNGLLQQVAAPGDNVHDRILAAGHPQEEHVCFWTCSDRRPRVQISSDQPADTPIVEPCRLPPPSWASARWGSD